jgi:hypothetical protein
MRRTPSWECLLSPLGRSLLSPYELDVTDPQESCVTIHGQLVEMAGPADQASAKTETILAVPPWMASRLKDQLDAGREED